MDLRQVENSAAHAKRMKTRRRVGFYGCNREVVRLEDEARNYPRSLRVDCPACGHNHTVKPAWRPYVQDLDLNKRAVQVS